MAGMNPKVIIMPLNYNGEELLEQSLPAVIEAAKNSPVQTEVWVIDNNSCDNSKEYVKGHFPDAQFISYQENQILFTYNDAFKKANADYILILNNDMIPDKDFIAPLIARMENELNCFAVSPKINAEKASDAMSYRLTGSFCHGHLKPVALDEGPGATLYLHGGAALIKREKFLELGGFDPLFFYFEDNDLSYRAWQKGWTCLFEPSSECEHLGSQTTLKVFGHEEKKRALKEKASNLFILKNISETTWLNNFRIWTFLKILKMIFSVDSYRLWAYFEALTLANKLQQTRDKTLSDSELMTKITNMSLKEL
ncbi:MAG: glycosyltransferase family 2 protein [Planctomycetes bacterium]|nr:glycosyltransferase family 2 protein [Planctomycetota bacterium]